jgi:hypothetical protein
MVQKWRMLWAVPFLVYRVRGYRGILIVNSTLNTNRSGNNNVNSILIYLCANLTAQRRGFWMFLEPSDCKIWSGVSRDSEPSITVLARASSNLRDSQSTQRPITKWARIKKRSKTRTNKIQNNEIYIIWVIIIIIIPLIIIIPSMLV